MSDVIQLYPFDPRAAAERAGAIRAAQDMLWGGIVLGDRFMQQNAEMKLKRLGACDMEGHRCGLCEKTSDEAGEPIYAYGEAVTSMSLKSGWYHNSCVVNKRNTYEAQKHERDVAAKLAEKAFGGEKVAGLVVDTTGKKVKLHTTEEMDAKTGKAKVVPYKGRPFNADVGESAAEAAVAPKPSGRGAVVRPDDDLSGLSSEEVIAKAKSMGYQELPTWPNGGVRVMRARNFIRNKRKAAPVGNGKKK